MAIIERYGECWERAKMFDVSEDGTVEWTDAAWPDKGAALKSARGVYVLYRGLTPIYVGRGLIASRIAEHAKDELAPWWDNVCWYHIDAELMDDEAVKAIEALLIAHIPGIWNGAQPQKPFGTECFLGAGGHATSELWKTV